MNIGQAKKRTHSYAFAFYYLSDFLLLYVREIKYRAFACLNSIVVFL